VQQSQCTKLGGVMGAEFLSKLLHDYIRELNLDEGTEEDKEYRKYLQRTMASLEGFADEEQDFMFEGWTKYRDWKWVVDDFYTREALGKVPGIIERFLRFRPILAGVIPSDEVSVYLSEATRCFIYGFFQASVALSRTAVEAGLNEHLRRTLGAVPPQDLVDKINCAERFKLVTPHAAQLAHGVRKAARDVLHRKPAKQGLAFDTLVQARGFLKELYEK